ncbi:LacI family DNA-binding transcriptional regulator [Acinetobacter baumannii]|nr:LacI family DNA-binding transcriptional regulator [Acinetobacter baumannii]
MARKKGVSSAQKVTLIDVAKIAGVSPITVSRVIREPDKVISGTRDRVLAAIKSSGYIPNMLAGSLASNKSFLVAILIPTIANSILSQTVQAIIDALSLKNYQTIIGLTNYNKQTEENLVKTLLSRRPDGVVLVGTDHTQETRLCLKQSGIPVIEAWDLSNDPIQHMIGFSHEKIGYDTANYLHKKGYKNISILTANDQRGLRRANSALDTLHDLGVKEVCMEIIPVPATIESGRMGLQHILEKKMSTDAIMCSSDTLAQGVFIEAAFRRINIPEDLAVIGFGDMNFASHLMPKLSSIQINGHYIGEQIAQTLLNVWEHKDKLAAPIYLDTGFKIIERESS